MNEKVLNEVMNAYADANGRARMGVGRNLNFRACESVPRDQAVTIMAKALKCRPDQEGYNAFRPELLERLPEDALVVLAREYSVCVYFKTDSVLSEFFRDTMCADEFDFKDGEYRIWWD